MRALLIPFVLVFFGCGAGALQRSTVAADVTHSLLEGSYVAVQSVCAEDRVETAERAATCIRTIEGYESAVAAQATWVATLLAVSEDEDAVHAARAMAAPVIRFLAEVGDFLRASGVDVPPIPRWLIDFVTELS